MALRTQLRSLTQRFWSHLRALSQRPWLGALVIVAVVMTPGFYRLEQIQRNTSDAVYEIRKTQEIGSPFLKALAEQATRIEEAVEASTELNEAILPCFDPDSQCAREAAAAEAARAGATLSSIIVTAYCQDQVLGETYTLSELTTCVGRRIKTEGTEP